MNHSIRPITYCDTPKGPSVGGVLLSDLSSHYGTPLYVIDAETFRHQCCIYQHAASSLLDRFLVLYAGKSNATVGLFQLAASQGLGVDVVSLGELLTALKAGVCPEKIYFHGNNKSQLELETALQYGVRIVVDHLSELSMLASLATDSHPCYFLIRLKPEIDAHTHDFIKTGHIDSKFGIDLLDLPQVASFIQTQPHFRFLGIHSHIGSQIFDSDPYVELASRMVSHLKFFRESFGMTLEEVNFGGGMGIMYTSEDDPAVISEVLSSLIGKFKALCLENGFEVPKVLFEPGRSIVGPSGITLYKIGAVKPIRDIKTYVFVDGGMADNPRPMMYGAKYTFDIATTESRDLKTVSIAGRYCESGDVLCEDVSLPDPQVGDILMVFGTGAYNYSMSSHYNRHPKPAMVMVDSGNSYLLVERESYEDLLRFDHPLSL